jgi:hypothetical protein
MGFIEGLADAPGSVNETAAMVAEILREAPRAGLPADVVDGYTVLPRPARWTATHDGRGPDRAA